ncbi:prefoldin subunit beta [Candidatus Woesearchaeota archaeon]|nr:prefoldin subunit beta [Candidatus Woesearchaeota archaeon]
MATQEENLQKLQMHEQNLQQTIMQKQQFQTQLLEAESALSELEKTDVAYKIIGNIMVASSKKDLMASLKEKKEMYELRVKSVEKQENKLKEQAQALRQEIMQQMKKED